MGAPEYVVLGGIATATAGLFLLLGPWALIIGGALAVLMGLFHDFGGDE